MFFSSMVLVLHQTYSLSKPTLRRPYNLLWFVHACFRSDYRISRTYPARPTSNQGLAKLTTFIPFPISGFRVRHTCFYNRHMPQFIPTQRSNLDIYLPTTSPHSHSVSRQPQNYPRPSPQLPYLSCRARLLLLNTPSPSFLLYCISPG